MFFNTCFHRGRGVRIFTNYLHKALLSVLFVSREINVFVKTTKCISRAHLLYLGTLLFSAGSFKCSFELEKLSSWAFQKCPSALLFPRIVGNWFASVTWFGYIQNIEVIFTIVNKTTSRNPPSRHERGYRRYLSSLKMVLRRRSFLYCKSQEQHQSARIHMRVWKGRLRLRKGQHGIGRA